MEPILSRIVRPVIKREEVGMQASTHTLKLDPTPTWRLVGLRKTSPCRQTLPVVEPIGFGAPGEPAITVPDAQPERRRPEIADALELGCFVTTLAAIGLLQLGVFALLA
jgi:hypothetical protein